MYVLSYWIAVLLHIVTIIPKFYPFPNVEVNTELFSDWVKFKKKDIINNFEKTEQYWLCPVEAPQMHHPRPTP